MTYGMTNTGAPIGRRPTPPPAAAGTTTTTTTAPPAGGGMGAAGTATTGITAGEITGVGAFQTVLLDELIPYIDAHFRTKAKQR